MWGHGTRLHATLAWALLAQAWWVRPAAHAQNGLTLDWRAPAECPSAEQAQAELARLLSRAVSAPSTSTAEARIAIERISAQQLRARIAVRAAGALREQALSDGDCNALTHAAALVVAIAIAPAERGRAALREPRARAALRREATELAGMRSSEVEPKSESPAAQRDLAGGAQQQAESAAAGARSQAQIEPGLIASAVGTQPLAASAASPEARILQPANAALTPAPQASTRRALPEPSAVTTTARAAAAPVALVDHPGQPTGPAANGGERELRTVLGLALGLSSGVIPNLAPSGMASAGIATHRLRVALRFGYAPSQRALLDKPSGVGGQVALVSAAAEIGLRLYVSGLEVPVYGGLEAGLLRADAEGVADHTARARAWLAGFLGSGLSVHWSRGFGMSLRVEGILPALRPSFALATQDGAESRVFHRPAALAARAFMGLELQLP